MNPNKKPLVITIERESKDKEMKENKQAAWHAEGNKIDLFD